MHIFSASYEVLPELRRKLIQCADEVERFIQVSETASREDFLDLVFGLVFGLASKRESNPCDNRYFEGRTVDAAEKRASVKYLTLSFCFSMTVGKRMQSQNRMTPPPPPTSPH